MTRSVVTARNSRKTVPLIPLSHGDAKKRGAGEGLDLCMLKNQLEIEIFLKAVNGFSGRIGMAEEGWRFGLGNGQGTETGEFSPKTQHLVSQPCYSLRN